MPSAADPDLKAQVIADRMAGMSQVFIAEKYGIDHSTVSRWMNSRDTPHALVSPEKRLDLGALVFGYVEANLTTLRAQMAVFSDEDWLRKQNAADAAILHGVIADKSVRLLELLKRDAAAGLREADQRER